MQVIAKEDRDHWSIIKYSVATAYTENGYTTTWNIEEQSKDKRRLELDADVNGTSERGNIRQGLLKNNWATTSDQLKNMKLSSQ